MKQVYIVVYKTNGETHKQEIIAANPGDALEWFLFERLGDWVAVYPKGFKS